MRTSHTSTLAAALLVAATCWAPGCDRAEVDPDPNTSFDSELQERAVRAGLTNRGLGSLFNVTHPEGLSIERDPISETFDGTDLTIGPVSQSVPLDTIDASVRGNQLELAMTTDSTSVTIPVRVQPGAQTRICRFRLDAVAWEIDAVAEDDGDPGWKLELAEPPTFDATQLRVRSVGSCPLVDDERVPDGLSQLLVTYLEASVATGIGRFVDVPIYKNLGLLEGRLAVRNVSSFRNRQGAIEFAGAAPENGGVSLDSPGLRVSLDLGVAPRIPTPRRQSCVPPPEQLPPPSDGTADPVDPTAVRNAGAELGIALSRSLTDRIVESAALGGFLCTGLDSGSGRRASEATIRRENTQLDVVGLQDAPVGGRFRAVVQPDNPPEIELRPNSNAVELRLEELSLELYGTRAGAPVKVLGVTTSPTFTLRPGEGNGSTIPLNIRAISVDPLDAERDLESPWGPSRPEDSRLQTWTRQLLLETFEDLFELPIPVLPDAPLDGVGAEIRDGDVVVYFRVVSGN